MYHARCVIDLKDTTVQPFCNIVSRVMTFNLRLAEFSHCKETILAKNDKEKNARLHKEQFESEKADIERWREMAPTMKARLRRIGCDLPFYDFLDSYDREFHRIASESIESIPTLLDIQEIDQEGRDDSARPYEFHGYKQVFFELDGRFAQYVEKNPKANVRGSAMFLLNDSGECGTVIRVPRNIKCSFRHPELKYSIKIGALFHEIGHAWDVENRLNIDPGSGRFDVVKAEAFAHCYALERLAEGSFVKMYDTYLCSMRSQSKAAGYVGEIAKLVLEQHTERSLVDWQDHFDQALAVM